MHGHHVDMTSMCADWMCSARRVDHAETAGLGWRVEKKVALLNGKIRTRRKSESFLFANLSQHLANLQHRNKIHGQQQCGHILLEVRVNQSSNPSAER